ncbi:hypothetical protein [Endozoicomonas sp. ALD040]|uniref:hypothetical protein n=1 Tax=unclassified Endozoicomonas TaxID=2644528 RepID=UPI003BB1E4A1
MKNKTYLLLILSLAFSSYSYPCLVSDNYKGYRSEAICTKEPLSIEEKAKKILSNIEKRPLKEKKINASIKSSFLEIRSLSKRLSNGKSTERLFVVVRDQNRTFSKDITEYSAVVFNDGLIVFPDVYDLILVMKDSGFSSSYINKLEDKLKNKHLAMAFPEVLSELGIPMDQVFIKNRFSKYLSRIRVKVDASEKVASLSGKLHKNTPHLIALLRQYFPVIEQLYLDKIPGTNDAVFVFEAALLVRYFSLDTYIGKDSLVYSGGVILFLSGANKFFHSGAILEDHGWQADTIEQGQPGSEFSDQQLMFNDLRETLGYPVLLKELTKNLTPKDFHRFTPDELSSMGAVLVDDKL